jgi:hypothetical protein
MKTQRLDTARLQKMNAVFYGALNVINSRKQPGEALHPIPAEFAPAVAEESLPHFPLIEGEDYGT